MGKKLFRRLLWLLLFFVILLNVIAAFHAYKFTHFANTSTVKTSNRLSTTDKIKIAFTGVSLPRPSNKTLPRQPFQTVYVTSNKKLECWLIKTENAKGTVILFHGYGGEKSSMLDKADVFLKIGYNTILVDFMGSGGSEGNTTTIGYNEAQEVKDCYEYALKSGFSNISLFGTSMGAVAIMRAIANDNIQPKSILIECPFGSMYQTVCARFRMQHLPTFPMASMLVFWGGIENGFWAFNHNPETYAMKIKCPTLLLYGDKDEKVTRDEIDTIFKNLNGKKTLVTYPLAGHENYLSQYKEKWINDVSTFLVAQ